MIEFKLVVGKKLVLHEFEQILPADCTRFSAFYHRTAKKTCYAYRLRACRLHNTLQHSIQVCVWVPWACINGTRRWATRVSAATVAVAAAVSRTRSCCCGQRDHFMRAMFIQRAPFQPPSRASPPPQTPTPRVLNFTKLGWPEELYIVPPL